MRITSWNLSGGDKRDAAASANCDLAVFQERRQPDSQPDELWSGDLPYKGLSVRPSGGWRLAPVQVRRSLPRYFVPVEVDGPESFQLISVWAQNDGADRYVRGIVRAVDLWAKRIAAQPTVIAGDFNANACWDAEHPKDKNFSALARRLDQLGLVSAYHAFFDEEFGKESRPTFYLYRHAARPYHLDYCFIPRAWLPRLTNVTVGSHEEWAAWSDHMPLTVELTEQ